MGRVCAIAEKWQIVPTHPAGGVRKDLFGFIDIISLDPKRGIVAIQSCGQNFSEHVRKILDSDCTEAVTEWLLCGGNLEIWGWSKRKRKLDKGWSKAYYWRPKIKIITMEDFSK